jgi:hypothetical protein
MYMAQSPCFLLPLLIPFCPLSFVPFTYLETLLAVTGSVHLGLRLLVNWPPLSQPFPTPSPLQIPSSQVKYTPHYEDFKNPASLVRNNNNLYWFVCVVAIQYLLFIRQQRDPWCSGWNFSGGGRFQRLSLLTWKLILCVGLLNHSHTESMLSETQQAREWGVRIHINWVNTEWDYI